MATAKDILIKPIKAATANALVRRVHYSGKVVNNSQLHFGVFLNGELEGAMQFGPSLDKRKIQRLVEGTGWNGFIELNRMAFSDRLPRNSESRALGVAFRLIRKHYPHIEWVVSFADGTQCGDGTIYRASGFVLTQIIQNNSMHRFPDGTVHATVAFAGGRTVGGNGGGKLKEKYGLRGAESPKAFFNRIGATPIPGYQLRYIYFLSPEARKRLTVPILPFSKIDEMGAGMYKGEKQSKRVKQATSGDHPESGGAAPTHTLQNKEP